MREEKAKTPLHFVGIGGIGMSGIAEVFLNQGYPVSGSDLQEGESTRRLAGLGARVQIGHRANNVEGARVVVISSAVRADNPEVVEAKRRRIPVIPRAEMLGELMRGKTGIAIGGTHGKTTTTSMLATVMTRAGLDPTCVIGGRVDLLGGNAKLGAGAYVVAEADESDGSFLHLPATYGIVTNIDNDHMDHFGNLGALEDAFVNFVGKLPFYGLAVVCGDDLGVKRCVGRFTKPVVTYGVSDDCDFVMRGLSESPAGSHFKVFDKGRELGSIRIGVPGKHNALNALAVTALATRLGLPFDQVASGLEAFGGVKRRFEIKFSDKQRKIAIVDDYGHHPTEIAATLAAAKTFWSSGRIITVFQPHRYSRTLHCKDGFLSAFRDADMVYMTDIYAAGEDPIPGVDAKLLVEEIRKVGQSIEHVATLDAAQSAILKGLKPGDLVICMGAGSITQLPARLVAELERSKK